MVRPASWTCKCQHWSLNFLCVQEDVYSRLTTGAADRQLDEKMEAFVHFSSE